jgi:hypothetical protein
MNGSLVVDHDDGHSTGIRNDRELLSDYTTSHLSTVTARRTSNVQPFRPHANTWQPLLTLTAILVFVCIYKLLLVCQLLISTTSVKLSHTREYACVANSRQNATTTQQRLTRDCRLLKQSGALTCGNTCSALTARSRKQASAGPLPSLEC